MRERWLLQCVGVGRKLAHVRSVAVVIQYSKKGDYRRLVDRSFEWLAEARQRRVLTVQRFGPYHTGMMSSTAKKKTYNLDERLIGDARRVLDARTDTETIQRALRKVVDDAEIEHALDALLSKGRFRSVFK